MKNWYIIQTFSGFEQKVAETLKENLKKKEADLLTTCLQPNQTEYDFNGDCGQYDKSECCITHCDETDECSGEIPPEIGNLTNLIYLKN